jgi:hypothetical protein
VAALDAGCRALLVVVFAIAVIGKLRSPSAFAEFAGTLVPLSGPRPGPKVLAVGVVIAELVAVATLLVRPAVGYAITAGVLVALSVGVWKVLRRALTVHCMCFGSGESVLTTGHLARNLLLAGFALTGFAAHVLNAGHGNPGVALSASAGGAVAGWCLTRWDDIVALLSPKQHQ